MEKPGSEAKCEDRKMEALRTKKAQHLLESIRSVERFSGEPRDLELFLEEMEAVHNLLEFTKISEVIDKDIRRVFISRISRQVLMDTGIRYSTPWQDTKRILQERYGGAKKPLARDALAILRMERRPTESAAEFAERLGENFRILSKKIQDGVGNAQVAQLTAAVFDELLRELLTQQVPEKIRIGLKAVKPKTIAEAILFICEEEDEEREFRQTGLSEWKRVENRSSRGTRNPHMMNQTRRTFNFKQRAEPNKNYNKGKFDVRDRRPKRIVTTQKSGCWECGQSGHFARECPYIFRRENRVPRNYAEAVRGEPMEINVTEKRRKLRPSQRIDGRSTSSSDSEIDGNFGPILTGRVEDTLSEGSSIRGFRSTVRSRKTAKQY